MMKLSFIALALIAASPAVAEGSEGVPQARVSFGDLDLTSDAGVRTLDRRLARAVTSVCSDTQGKSDLGNQMAARRCIVRKQVEVAAQRDRILAERAEPTVLAGRVP